jgi:DNA-binding NarL/FixJ family response regulator
VIRVLLVDDHPVFRQGLRVLLEAHGFTVVGEAGDVETGLGMLGSDPDVVLMDIGLPGDDGLTGTVAMLRRRPGTRVLVVSMFRDDTVVAEALEAGASGYLSKDAGASELVQAVRAVAEGSLVVGMSLVERVRGMTSGGGLRAAAPEAALFPELSERERQVLGLVAQRLDNTQIAERLGVSAKTVANYVSTVLVRLRAPDRAALAGVVAARRGARLCD